MRRGLTEIQSFTARELDQALAIALREQSRTDAETVVREIRRRGIYIKPNLYHWLRSTYFDLSLYRRNT